MLKKIILIALVTTHGLCALPDESQKPAPWKKLTAVLGVVIISSIGSGLSTCSILDAITQKKWPSKEAWLLYAGTAITYWGTFTLANKMLLHHGFQDPSEQRNSKLSGICPTQEVSHI